MSQWIDLSNGSIMEGFRQAPGHIFQRLIKLATIIWRQLVELSYPSERPLRIYPYKKKKENPQTEGFRGCEVLFRVSLLVRW
jgi:hypothetical protein